MHVGSSKSASQRSKSVSSLFEPTSLSSTPSSGPRLGTPWLLRNNYTSSLGGRPQATLLESDKSTFSDAPPSLMIDDPDAKTTSEPQAYRLSSSMHGMHAGEYARICEKDEFLDDEEEFEYDLRKSFASADVSKYDRIRKKYHDCMLQNQQLKKQVLKLEKEVTHWMVLYKESTRQEALVQEKVLNLEDFYNNTDSSKRSTILEARRKLSEKSGLKRSTSSLQVAASDPFVFDIFSMSDDTGRKDSVAVGCHAPIASAKNDTRVSEPVRVQNFDLHSRDEMSDNLRNDILIECRDQISRILWREITMRREHGVAEIQESAVRAAAEAASASLGAALQKCLPGLRRQDAPRLDVFDISSGSAAVSRDPTPSSKRAVDEFKASTLPVQRNVCDAGTQLDLGRRSLLQNIHLDDQQLILAHTYEKIRRYRSPETAWYLRDAMRLIVDTTQPDFEGEALGIVDLIRNFRKDVMWRHAITA